MLRGCERGGVLLARIPEVEGMWIARFFERADRDVADAHLVSMLGCYGDGGGALEEERSLPHRQEGAVEERQLRLQQCAPLLLA